MTSYWKTSLGHRERTPHLTLHFLQGKIGTCHHLKLLVEQAGFGTGALGKV